MQPQVWLNAQVPLGLRKSTRSHEARRVRIDRRSERSGGLQPHVLLLFEADGLTHSTCAPQHLKMPEHFGFESHIDGSAGPLLCNPKCCPAMQSNVTDSARSASTLHALEYSCAELAVPCNGATLSSRLLEERWAAPEITLRFCPSPITIFGAGLV